jgi:hypothetical protein
MKTWSIEVPFTASYTISGDTFLEITEEEVLEHFEVDSLDEVTATELEEYIKERGEDDAFNIPRQILADQFREEVYQNATDFEVDIDSAEICEEEELDE